MPATPRYTELVPSPSEGLVDPASLPRPLPYGLEPRDFLRTVEDVHSLLHQLNTVLHNADYAPLETLLDPAGFSGMISRTVASRLAAASRRLVVNGYHNGYPDLIVEGRYPRDSVAHGEGLEVKASRSAGSWQSHGPRGGWFVFVQFALDQRIDVALFDRDPTQIQAVMVAELVAEDWSWQPAAEGKIRSGTASVVPSGRAKLRAGAVWIAPAYQESHQRLLAKERLDAFRQEADGAVLGVLAGAPDPLTAHQIAESIAPTIGVEPGALISRVRASLSRLKKAGSVDSTRGGAFSPRTIATESTI